MYPLPYLIVASLLLLLVAGWDIARRRIPNWLNAALLVTGFGAQGVFHGWKALVGGLTAAFITFCLLWMPWATRRLGGGDVKASIGAAVWLGLGALINFYLYASIAAGVASLACLVASSARVRREVVENLRLVFLRVGLPPVTASGGEGRVSVPFGAAAAAATLLLLWWKR
jgi:Flp pilus assembly protein protease CpaA